ncbi:eukaryotic translation initiation factor 3 subunit 8, putative [Eimeria necatrix]|uniref:Eukaryotic translation initiation factor 3 subunit C n=1 Tax=Eimeria necatrix TaxID=51315 RepID=U6N001_9EIME|nr:eukaryotic translation initiation factor 3 subunit 8, putative [Eimeria necatrix]CDJ68623.1 eukaryotic translation initiation factor 3 subunit 8, putative [Eimeria necatrix]
MQSKFWAAGADSLESEYSSESDDQEQVQQEKAVAPPSRWAAAETSSSDDEGRVVKSLKDRRWGAMREVIRQMENHMKILDFAELGKDYETLLKSYNKAHQVIEQEGVPNFFIRALVELESFVEEKLKDKENFKKLSRPKALALNTLRAKVRKTTEPWASSIADCKENPEKFETQSEESDEADSDSDFSENDSSELSESSDGSSSSSDDEEKGRKGKTEGSDDDSEWSDSEAEEESQEEDGDRQKDAMAKWGVREEGEKTRTKSAKKKSSSKSSKTPAKEPTPAGAEGGFSTKDMQHLFDSTDINEEVIAKRVQMVVEKRGRRGVDKMEQMRILKRLAELAETVSPQCHLEVLGHLISAEFDTTSGVFTSMPLQIWMETFAGVKLLLSIMEQNKGAYLVPLAGLAESSTPEEIQQMSASILTSFVERLDDDLTKSLQSTDVHSDEYKERLGKSIDILALLWRTFCFLDERGFKAQAATVALKVNEHMHYKPDTIASKMWDVLRKELPEELCKGLPGGNLAPRAFIETLTRYVFKYSASQREKIRALLHVAYSKSLHDDYYQARDLMHTPNIQELAMQTDISTQILYNRNLVQLGLCAFRNGLIQDAHACLSQICPKHKELLAQGLSNLKNVERTQEQERAEKRRLLPYHMHISMELIECVHNICAMLLEVPHMAHDAFDPRKRPISKHFRRMLEMYDRQAFVGPPENARETVMAATKALQRGDWSDCARHIWSLSIWDKMFNKEHIQQMLLQKIKAEAMRTYIFTYLSLYDSFAIGQLASMFDLSLNAVHSIVSKMMINEEIHASWDETSQFILISRVKHTRLQQLALTLAENVANAVEQNELTLNMKNPKFALTHERRFMRDGDRAGWGTRDREDGGGHRSRPGFRGRAGLNPVGARGRGLGRGTYRGSGFRGNRGSGDYRGDYRGESRGDRGEYRGNSDQRDPFRIKFSSPLTYN